MLIYGDGVSDVDIDKLVVFYKVFGKILIVIGVWLFSCFGELMVDVNGMVIEFNEKLQVIEGCIFGGYFVCDWWIFDYLFDGDDLVFEQELMKCLVQDGQMVMYGYDGFW